MTVSSSRWETDQDVEATVAMNSTMRRICAPILAVLALVLVSSCGSGAEGGQQPSTQQQTTQRTTQIRVGGPGPNAGLWPIYVAQSEGFFEKAGVQVAVTYAGGGQGVQQVIGGDLDLFVTNPDQPIAAIQRGGKLTGISGAINSPFSLVGKPGIENVAALRKGPVGAANIAGADMVMIRAILKNSGLGPNDYDVTQTGSGPNKLSAMTTGAVNAVTLTQPQDLQYLTQTQGAHKLADSSELGEIQTIAQFANSAWADDNSDTLVAYLRAQLQAREWLADPKNREQAMAVLAKETKISPEIAGSVYDQYVSQDLFDKAIDLDIAGVDRWLTLAEEAGLGHYDTASKYFNTSYLQRAQQQGK